MPDFRDRSKGFLYDEAVSADNNRAEREIRPAVIARKNSCHNMSQRGARTQSILMSVYRTLKLRGHDPIETIADALAVHISGGGAPPLPSSPVSKNVICRLARYRVIASWNRPFPLSPQKTWR